MMSEAGIKLVVGLVAATLLAVAVVVAACGSGGAETPTPIATPITSIPMATQATAPTVYAAATSFPTPPQAPSPTAQPAPAPTEAIEDCIPEESIIADTFPFAMAPSVDLQIFEADVIVVASLVSVTAGFQQNGDVYRPGQILRFRSSEYLKGTGPTEFVVEVPIVEVKYTQCSMAKALALKAAQYSISLRNTNYDQRLGILFLSGPLYMPTIYEGQSDRLSRSASSSATAFNFERENLAVKSWEYSIDSIARVWMPAKNDPPTSTSRGRSPRNSDPEYITGRETSPPTVIRLSELKTKISALATRLASGAEIPGFKECVRGELDRERYYRDYDPYTVYHTIPSGADPDSQALRDEPVRHGDSVYRIFHVRGKDASYFQAVIVDDDDDPARYSFKYTPSRPLPARLYEVDFTYQLPDEIPCGQIDDPVRLREVTVTAPTGTLHEAFFDPVTVGTAVKADATNGALKPTSFTVGGTATELTGLEWSNNQVVLTLGTHVSLSGQVLEFIELDGSVSLSLVVDEAEVDDEVGTYSWSVTSQPWEEGDKLMLRIREGG